MQTNTSSKAAPVRRTAQAMPLNDLYTVKDFITAHSRLITLHALRGQLRNRAENGLGKYVVWMGNKLLISRTGYEKWLGGRAGATKGEGGDRG